MEHLSELDECIQNLEQLHLSLEPETSPNFYTPKSAPSNLFSEYRFDNAAPKINNNTHVKYSFSSNESHPDGIDRIDATTNCRMEMTYNQYNQEIPDFQSIQVSSPRPKLHQYDKFPEPPPIADFVLDHNNYIISNNNSSSPRSTPTNSSHAINQNSADPNNAPSTKIVAKTYNQYAESIDTNYDTASIATSDTQQKTVVRFFCSDKTTKAVMVTESMNVSFVIRLLMEKMFGNVPEKCAVVEKVPSLKMERFMEEHEYLLDCINSWPTKCSNMIFFEHRSDIYGMFENSKEYLGDNYCPGAMSLDLIKKLYHSLMTGKHEFQDYLYIKKPQDNQWKRKFCVLNNRGIFACPKKHSKSQKEVIVMLLNNQFHLYTTTGGWTKLWNAPTPFGFAFKPYGVVDVRSDQLLMFCASDEQSMKRWCSNLRLCKFGELVPQNYENMRSRSIYVGSGLSASVDYCAGPPGSQYSTASLYRAQSVISNLRPTATPLTQRVSLPTNTLPRR